METCQTGKKTVKRSGKGHCDEHDDGKIRSKYIV